AMHKDSGISLETLLVDGVAVANDFLIQFQANLLNAKIERPEVIETTALGYAYLAGLATGYCKSTDELKRVSDTDTEFKPEMEDARRGELYEGWQAAVKATQAFKPKTKHTEDENQ